MYMYVCVCVRVGGGGGFVCIGECFSRCVLASVSVYTIQVQW